MLDAKGRRLSGPHPHGGGPVLVTHISPDGGQMATIETLVETTTPFPGGPPTPHQVPYLFLARADGSGRETVAPRDGHDELARRSPAARRGRRCGAVRSSGSACW